MNPQEWLDIPGNNQAKLSRLSGISPPTLSRMLNSKDPMSMRNAVRLDFATGGQIRAEDCTDKDAELIEYLRSNPNQLKLPL